MERITSFDYLHDPTPRWIAAVLRSRLPKRARASALASIVATTMLFACMGIEHAREVRATHALTQARARLAGVRALLARERLAATDVARLFALEDRIRGFRSSGYRRALALAAFAERLPQNAWLTDLEPEEEGTRVTGRADSVAAIGAFVRALSPQRFGRVVVRRATRMERPSSRATFAFALEVGHL